MPMNPTTGKGWKKDVDASCKIDIVKCIKENAYSKDEVFVNISDSVKVEEFFHDTLWPIVQLMRFEPGSITHKSEYSHSSSNIQLNNNLSYYVAIIDPKAQFWSESPDILPRIMLTMKEKIYYFVSMKVNIFVLCCFMFLAFQAIRHEKLNQPHSPCDSSMDYSFGLCIEDYINKQVGCQPPWSRFNVSDTILPLCENWTQLEQISNWSSQIKGEMVRSEILETTGCKPPCIFMEYKAREKQDIILDKTGSALRPYFTSNIVEIQREKEAFSFISLVADIGGVLGLFIGFNFLMVWDWTVLAVKTVWRKNTTTISTFITNK